MAFKRLITYAHGPFWHQINKGGLNAIIESGKLKASEAAQIAGGAEAVRAHTQELAAGDAPVIKFYARTAPRSGTPGWLAEWRPAPEDYIDIQVEEVTGNTKGHE